MPYSCYKLISSCCCCDYRCSYPAEAKGETPCVCNLLGLNICLDGGYAIGCCEPFSSLRIKSQNSVTDQFKSSAQVLPEVKISEGKVSIDVSGKTRMEDLNVCCGFCCSTTSLLCKFPDVFGTSSVCSCLCCKCENHSCKPAVEKGEAFTGEIYLCDTATVICMWPKTCFSCVSQLFCYDHRCAFPCESKGDVPCLINCCFINCCYDWHCHCGQTWFHPLGALIVTKGAAPKVANLELTK